MHARTNVKSTADEFNLTFYSVFKITNTALLVTGAHPKTRRDIKWLIHYIFGMMLTWFITSLSFISIFSNDIQNNDYTEACRHSAVAILGCIISFKYIIMLIYQDDIMELIRAIDRDYERARSLTTEEQKVVRHYAERGAWVTKLWLLIGVGTGALFPLQSICLMIFKAATGNFSKIMVLDVYLPGYDDIKYENYVFIPIYVISFINAGYAGLMHTAFDPLVPIFVTHCCGQLELVKIQIRQLFSEDQAVTDAERKIRLKRIIEHLSYIYGFLEIARKDFTMTYEVVVKTSTILIPVVMYEIIESIKLKAPSLEFISLGVGSLIYFYIPCYYSDLLMEKSLKLGEELYYCGWERQWDRSTRQSIAFMLTRASKPLAMTTAFGVMCLNSFTEMCRQSYAIFNLMNAALE